MIYEYLTNQKEDIMTNSNNIHYLINNSETALMMFQSFYIQGCSIIEKEFEGENKTKYQEIMYMISEQYRAMIVTCNLLYNKFDYYTYEIKKSIKALPHDEALKKEKVNEIIRKFKNDFYTCIEKNEFEKSLELLCRSRCIRKRIPDMLLQQTKILLFMGNVIKNNKISEGFYLVYSFNEAEQQFEKSIDKPFILHRIIDDYKLYFSYMINSFLDIFHSLLTDNGDQYLNLKKLLEKLSKGNVADV